MSRVSRNEHIVVDAETGEFFYLGPNESEAKNQFVRMAVAGRRVAIGDITPRGKKTIHLVSTALDKQKLDALYRKWVFYPGGRRY